jgi:hypothetical protein
MVGIHWININDGMRYMRLFDARYRFALYDPLWDGAVSTNFFSAIV